jgi:hypothetical protein
MMRSLVVIAVGLSLAACAQESDPQAEKLARVQAELDAAKEQTAKPKAQVAASQGVQPEPTAAEPATSGPAAISAKDMGRVCRASIGAIMGRNPAIISAKIVAEDLVETKYTRDDGTVWKNQCRFEPGRIVWRTVDAFGPGSGLGRWRDEDELLFRIESGDRIWVRLSMSGSLLSEESYTVR